MVNGCLLEEQKKNRAVLLEVKNLKKYFPVRSGLFSKIKDYVHAVDDVSFSIRKGETLGLVGESGSGKSTLARVILGLLKPTAGSVNFCGQDIFKLDRIQLKGLRREIQLIFQDPYASLNPRLNVETIVGEALHFHKVGKAQHRLERVDSLLRRVGLREEHKKRFPHEFSGGQRQRIGIARALALQPKLIIGDEPVSALDVSIQAQVLNLLLELKEEFQLSYLIIAHDLRIVEYISDRVAVMYLGKMVELASAGELYKNPLHPYTRLLLSAIPNPDPTARSKRHFMVGESPSPIKPPAGCRFYGRCPQRTNQCEQIPPLLREVRSKHWIACHLSM